MKTRLAAARVTGSLAASGLALVCLPHVAFAGVGISVTPTFPAAVTIGTTAPASLSIAWANADDGSGTYTTHSDNISGVTLTPACGEGSFSSTCGLPEPNNPITLSMTGTGSSGCTVIGDPSAVVSQFTLTPQAGGAYSITPSFQLLPNATCVISFVASFNSKPTQDSAPTFGGVQTAIHAGAIAVDATNSVHGGGVGGGTISFPTLTTTPVPAQANLVDGGIPRGPRRPS